jgi:hypothetical protein
MPNFVDDTQIGLDVRERWAEIRRISDRLLQHARDQEWKAVGELHALRDGLMRSFFAEPVAVSEAEEVGKGILAVLESDKEVIALTRQEKSNTAAKMQRLNSGREARKAYTDIGIGFDNRNSL